MIRLFYSRPNKKQNNKGAYDINTEMLKLTAGLE